MDDLKLLKNGIIFFFLKYTFFHGKLNSLAKKKQVYSCHACLVTQVSEVSSPDWCSKKEKE